MIIVIEDSKPMRNLIKRTLRQAGFGHHEVIEAGNGQDGLQMIKESKPDIILSDWNMPIMDGMELLKTLKQEGIAIPFGFCTSEQTAEMRDAAEAEGAKFLIGKPFTAQAFNHHLTAILGDKDQVVTAGIPLRDWLEAAAEAMKSVAVNPLGYASAGEVNSYPDEITPTQAGTYISFEGGESLLWLCLFSDERGCQSWSRALFGMGPDEEDLPTDEVGDAMGEIMNIVAGLVKSQMEGRQIRCKIGLPHYLDSPVEVAHRPNKKIAEVRMGPVAGHLVVVQIR